jgi:hypothetical protein
VLRQNIRAVGTYDRGYSYHGRQETKKAERGLEPEAAPKDTLLSPVRTHLLKLPELHKIVPLAGHQAFNT